MRKKPIAVHKPIIEGYCGSMAHGDYEGELDDVDVMRIVMIPPWEYWQLHTPYEGMQYKRGKFDITTYSLAKFLRLLNKGNPNVISLLWLKKEHYRHISPVGQRVIDSRMTFIGKKSVYDSFMGYAVSQLHRMTSGKKYEGYMGEKRKALVDKFGYDTKNAAHLIRLLRMCGEFLTTGEFQVYRENDRMGLLDIKRGKWTLEQVKKEAKMQQKICEMLYDGCKIREYPDIDGTNEFHIMLMGTMVVMLFDNPDGRELIKHCQTMFGLSF